MLKLFKKKKNVQELTDHDDHLKSDVTDTKTGLDASTSSEEQDLNDVEKSGQQDGGADSEGNDESGEAESATSNRPGLTRTLSSSRLGTSSRRLRRNMMAEEVEENLKEGTTPVQGRRKLMIDASSGGRSTRRALVAGGPLSDVKSRRALVSDKQGEEKPRSNRSLRSLDSTGSSERPRANSRRSLLNDETTGDETTETDKTEERRMPRRALNRDGPSRSSSRDVRRSSSKDGRRPRSSQQKQDPVPKDDAGQEQTHIHKEEATEGVRPDDGANTRRTTDRVESRARRSGSRDGRRPRSSQTKEDPVPEQDTGDEQIPIPNQNEEEAETVRFDDGTNTRRATDRAEGGARRSGSRDALRSRRSGSRDPVRSRTGSRDAVRSRRSGSRGAGPRRTEEPTLKVLAAVFSDAPEKAPEEHIAVEEPLKRSHKNNTDDILGKQGKEGAPPEASEIDKPDEASRLLPLDAKQTVDVDATTVLENEITMEITRDEELVGFQSHISGSCEDSDDEERKSMNEKRNVVDASDSVCPAEPVEAGHGANPEQLVVQAAEQVVVGVADLPDAPVATPKIESLKDATEELVAEAAKQVIVGAADLTDAPATIPQTEDLKEAAAECVVEAAEHDFVGIADLDDGPPVTKQAESFNKVAASSDDRIKEQAVKCEPSKSKQVGRPSRRFIPRQSEAVSIGVASGGPMAEDKSKPARDKEVGVDDSTIVKTPEEENPALILLNHIGSSYETLITKSDAKAKERITRTEKPKANTEMIDSTHSAPAAVSLKGDDSLDCPATAEETAEVDEFFSSWKSKPKSSRTLGTRTAPRRVKSSSGEGTKPKSMRRGLAKAKSSMEIGGREERHATKVKPARDLMDDEQDGLRGDQFEDQKCIPPPTLVSDSKKVKKVRRAHQDTINEGGPCDVSLPPPSLAGDFGKGGRKVRLTKVDPPPPNLAPPSLAGDDFKNTRKIRKAKEGVDSCEQSLVPPSLAGDFGMDRRSTLNKGKSKSKINDNLKSSELKKVTKYGTLDCDDDSLDEEEEGEDTFEGEITQLPKNNRKIRRAKPEIIDEECPSLAPPSLAGDFDGRSGKKKKQLKFISEDTTEGTDAKDKRSAMISAKKAQSFSILDCDNDSLDGELPESDPAPPRRGLLKAKSGSNLLRGDRGEERRPNGLMKKARSSMNVLGKKTRPSQKLAVDV